MIFPVDALTFSFHSLFGAKWQNSVNLNHQRKIQSISKNNILIKCKEEQSGPKRCRFLTQRLSEVLNRFNRSDKRKLWLRTTTNSLQQTNGGTRSGPPSSRKKRKKKTLSHDSDDLRRGMAVKLAGLHFFYVEDCGWYEVGAMMACKFVVSQPLWDQSYKTKTSRLGSSVLTGDNRLNISYRLCLLCFVSLKKFKRTISFLKLHYV